MPAQNIGISPLSLYIGMAISGIFTGIGVALGTYIANKYILEKTKKIAKALEDKLSNKGYKDQIDQ
ncbi:MAG: hypothetical protein PHZ07_01605 [Patescibacteria group bacterium]|nr:hypothetical protein [Patescibacteria group bacterium]MDD4303870.1 hypothetical protein [Patescibacteria group bacterium]MDD4695143.1 hypothetical protein [Patescibacteria group bacterium]